MVLSDLHVVVDGNVRVSFSKQLPRDLQVALSSYFAAYPCESGIGPAVFGVTCAMDTRDGNSSFPDIAGCPPTIKERPEIYQYWVDYRDIRLPVAFDGGLLLGGEFLRAVYGEDCRFWGIYEHPHAFRQVHEFLFIKGRLVRHVDHSAVFTELRALLDNERKSQDQRMEKCYGTVPRHCRPDSLSAAADVQEVTDPNFRMWGVFRDFDAVRAREIGPYSLSFEEMEKKRIDLEEWG